LLSTAKNMTNIYSPEQEVPRHPDIDEDVARSIIRNLS
jgi:hypothetical protein